MGNFQPGEIVDVRIRGVRILGDADNGATGAFGSGAGADQFYIPPQAEITHRAPAEWPPRHRDLWQDGNGTLYFAYSAGVCEEQFGDLETDAPDAPIRLVDDNGSHIEVEDALQTFGPLALIRRVATGDGLQPVWSEDLPVDELARTLSAADVEINGGDYPSWDDLRDSGQDAYRQAARILLSRYQIAHRDQQDGGEGDD